MSVNIYSMLKFKVAIFIAVAVSTNLTWAQEDFKFCREAEIALRDKNLDEAILPYKRCLQEGNLSNATASIVNRNLGLIYFNKKEYLTSITYFDEAIRLNKKDPWGDLASRANSWASSGNLSKALEDYDEALKQKPNFALAQFNRGIAYEKFGKGRSAKVSPLTA